MNISVQILEELKVFVYAVTFGAIFAFLYDAVLILRKVFSHRPGLCMMEDFLYWLMVIPCCLVAMFQWTQGVVHWYFLFGALFGVFLYKGSISKVYIAFTTKIIQYIVVHIKKAIHIVEKPFEIVKNRVKSAHLAGKNYLKKFTIIPKRWLTVCIKWFKIILCKHKRADSLEENEGTLGDVMNGR